MYLITTSTYPNDKVKDVANMYLKAITKYPDDNKIAVPIVQAAVLATPQGIKVIHIFDVKKGKLDDAMALAVNRMVMFYDIQGFRVTFETYLNLEEALKFIGM